MVMRSCAILISVFWCVGNAQTLVDLRTQSKSIDFSSAATTKPFKAGTVFPAACSVGEAFYKTDAPAGMNLYGCTALNSWTLEGAAGGGSSMTIAVGGVTQGTQAALNYISGNGIVQTCSNNIGSNRIDCAPAIDTAYALTRATDQSGTDKSCISANGATSTHTCGLTPALSILTQNMEINWATDSACQGSDTLNINSTGPIPIQKEVAGVLVNVAANDCAANSVYELQAVGNPVAAFKITLPGGGAGFSGLTTNSILVGGSSTTASTPGGAGFAFTHPATNKNQLELDSGSAQTGSDPIVAMKGSSGANDFALIKEPFANGDIGVVFGDWTSSGSPIIGPDGSGGLQISSRTNGRTNLTLRADTSFTQHAGGSPIDNSPSIASGFGTGPALVNASDVSGRINVGTGGTASSGVINFGRAYNNAPACVANDENTKVLVQASATTTQLTLSSASAWTASDKLTWICFGQ